MKQHTDDTIHKYIAKASLQNPKIYEPLYKMMTTTNSEGAAAAHKGRAHRRDHTAILPMIAVPSLIVVGTEDSFTPIPIARLMSDNIPGARLAIIEGAGHLPNMEAPAEFNKALDEFLTPPPARLPFTAAVKSDNTLYISGQIGADPSSGVLNNGSFASEAHQVMKNIGHVLQKHNLTYSHLVNVTIYLTDMGSYTETNEVYSQYFADTFPARVCIAVKELPMKARIEISAIAQLSSY
jgi:reactive intermediate/imine deaminase